jgi:hypothetical protein
MQSWLTIHRLSLDAIMAIILREEELEVCLRVADASDLVLVVDKVAAYSLAGSVAGKVSLPQFLKCVREFGVFWETRGETAEHFDLILECGSTVWRLRTMMRNLGNGKRWWDDRRGGLKGLKLFLETSAEKYFVRGRGRGPSESVQ